jgi:hypothetical protein
MAFGFTLDTRLTLQIYNTIILKPTYFPAFLTEKTPLENGVVTQNPHCKSGNRMLPFLQQMLRDDCYNKLQAKLLYQGQSSLFSFSGLGFQ